LPGGIAWYRKTINIPVDKKGQKVYLYFEGVYNRSDVYVNGQLLGHRPNGYISFFYDITPHIQFGKDNLIAVKVDHSRSADSRWYSGSGIYRDVWLVYANPVHIQEWGIYAVPQMKTENDGNLKIQVEMKNESLDNAYVSIENELIAPDGKSAGKSNGKLSVRSGGVAVYQKVINVRNPKLWSLESPQLYTLKTRVYHQGNLIEEQSIQTGFRTFTFDADKGFALNGKWMKMKGVCLHHDAGVLGAASYKEVWRRRLINLKEIGVNAIRTSHNPQASHLYELCDELGLLVMNEAFDEWEFPKRKWLTGWNHGTPGYQGTYDFFEAWGEKDLQDMVRRDRNHLSIFAWSIGNEVDYPNDPYSHPVLNGGSETGFTQPIFGGYKKDAPDAMRLGAIAKRLAAVVRKYDPSRPVTAGLAGVAMSNETEYPSALDICGYNYTENLYDKDHAKYPKRVIYGSENRHELSAWKAVRDKSFIFGQFLWTGIDYLGESGQWPSRGFYSGLLDFGGFIKPRGYFRQSLWSEKPMAYLGTYASPLSGGENEMKDVWSQLESRQNRRKDERPSMDAWPVWNYEAGQLIRVVCYTNTAYASLKVNGKDAGEKKSYDDQTGIIYWDIPYEEGKLEVTGMDKDGKVLVQHHIQSSSTPFALQVKEPVIQIKQGELAQIEITVVDVNGVKVSLADNEILCQIAGEARLLGLEGSNNSDMSDYTDKRHRAYQGRLFAYIKPENKAGKVQVKFSAPLLKTVMVEIQVK